MSTALVLYFALATVLVVAQQWLLQRMPLPWRAVHLAISLTLIASLWPVVKDWQVEREVPERDRRLGLVLWDRSASTAELDGQRDTLSKRLAQANVGTIEWVDFSAGCLPPHGTARAQGATDLSAALTELDDTLVSLAPDWIWLVSDGGFDLQPAMDFQEADLYLSRLQPPSGGKDISIGEISTDPVWYTRTEAPLRVQLSRSQDGGREAVSLLFRLDGQLVSTTPALFEPGELETEVQVRLLAEHAGPHLLEVQIAEGQGGSKISNDHRLATVEVIPDRIRILRVVGRPNWSSKFLRDQLVKREDVDLVDFHILRSMNDRVKAGPDELALIPFPVEELFVENIDSFDLIIWQNFDHQSYPFFKPVYLRNMEKVVRGGTGMLIWSGGLNWSTDRGPLYQLAPVATGGHLVREAQGNFRVAKEDFLSESIGPDLEQQAQSTLRVYHGEMHPDARSALDFAETPLVALREVGRGRVVQVLSDQLWRWAFEAPPGREDAYDHFVRDLLKWMLHHPDSTRRQITLPRQLAAGESFELLSGEHVGKKLEWLNHEEDVTRSVELVSPRQKATAPEVPGVYRVRLEGSPHEQTVGVVGLQGEERPAHQREKTFEGLEAMGFQSIDLKKGLPISPDAKLGSATRATGEPWYRHPLFLILWTLGLVAHWLILNRILTYSPGARQRSSGQGTPRSM